jgi:CheY-like chemotaxis protein
MKSLTLICSEHSQNYFKQIANIRFPSIKSVRIYIVVCRKDLDELIKNPKKDVDCFWILLELGWDHKKLFEGYDVSLELMRLHDYDHKNLQFVFFSLHQRRGLLKIVSDEKNIFPKAFQHYQLPIEDCNEISSKPISNRSYKLIKQYALSKSSIIGDSIHRLENVLRMENYSEELSEVLERLKSVRSILTPETSTLLDNAFRGKDKIEVLLDQLNILKESIDDNDKIKPFLPHRILRSVIILEDNKELGGKLKDSLQSFCSDIILCNSGEECIEIIDRQASTLDLLFCDLELLTQDRYWQDVQGIDVIEYVKINYPKVYLVVLSGLPTTFVKILIPERSFINEHVRKGQLLKTGHILSEDLLPIVQNAREFTNRNLRSLNGPNKGMFKLIRHLYFGFKLNNDEQERSFIDENHRKAHEIYMYYRNDNLSECKDWNCELYSTKTTDEQLIWDKLITVLALRKMILSFILEDVNSARKIKDRIAYKFDFNKFKDKNGLDFLTTNFKDFINSKVWFNVVEVDDDKQQCYIYIENLFDEEAEFVDAIRGLSIYNKVLDFESFRLFKNFMEHVNTMIGGYFTFDESVNDFQNKLAGLTATIMKSGDHMKFTDLYDQFPYTLEQIPSDFSDLQKAVAGFYALEDMVRGD